MTKGGPGFTSDVMASVIYKQYQAGFYGLSTAGNVVLFLLVTVIVVPLFWFLNRKDDRRHEHLTDQAELLAERRRDRRCSPSSSCSRSRSSS